VVKDEKLKGILSDRDIKDFSPSRATTLDVYELHYILAKTKVKEIMKTRVFTTTSDTPIEEAALTMFDQKIGCLPVVGNGKLSGIISDRDIFRALVDITGVRHGGHRICVTIEDRPGSIKEVADIVRTNGFRLQSILTSYEKMPEGYRKIVIRTKGEGKFGGLKAELMGRYRGVLIKKG
jgi:acetoin utilization protein AcuB